MKVTLRLPTTLLRRFREVAADMSMEGSRDLAFHEMLHIVAVESVFHYCIEAPPASLMPLMAVESAMPDGPALSVARLAGRSGLTLEQTWHRLVLEFCERSEAPGLVVEFKREVA